VKGTLRGSLLSYVSFLTGKLLTLGSTLVLARLLAPGDFGLVGYALLMLSFLTVLKSVGMGRAMIYRQDLSDDEAGEVFVIWFLFAVVFTCASWLSAPLVADFFGEPRMTIVARVLSLSFILNALGEAHETQLKKRMQFGRAFTPAIVFSLVRGVVSVVLALAGAGYWSLVWGQLCGDAAHTLTCWGLFRWRPRLRLSRATGLSILRFGLSVTLLELIALVVINADEVIVGRQLGSSALGLYSVGYTLAQFVTISLASAVSVAVFPAFAVVQSDDSALRAGYLEVLRWTSLVLAPAGAGLFVTAPNLIHAFFNSSWWPMIAVVQALALYGAIFAIGWSAGDVWLAFGRPDLQWKLDAGQIVVLVPALLAGAAIDGITGVAIAQVVAIIPYSAARFWLIHETLGVRYGDIAARLRLPLAAAAALAAACGAVAVAGSGLPPGATLALQIVVGAVVYIGALLRFDGELRAHAFARFRYAETASR
jgi:O-antigen/teichoic acid export membrane protein